MFKKIKLKKLRSDLLELVTHTVSLKLAGVFHAKSKFPYTMDDLLKMPSNTFGNDLALHLQKKNFSLLPNFGQHDCKHFVLNYNMDEEGEVRMQFYFLGNKHYSFTVLGTLAMSLLLMPKHWKHFFNDYKRGRKNITFENINYTQLVYLPTEQVRKQFI